MVVSAEGCAAGCRPPPEIAAQAHQIGFITDRAGAIIGDDEVSLPMRRCRKAGASAFIGGDGEKLEVDSTNFCTVFVLDKHHLATAGHCFPTSIRRGAMAPHRYVIILGPISPQLVDARLRAPRSRFVDGSELELVASAHDGEEAPDWAVLRTTRSLERSAMPLQTSVAAGDRVQAIGFADYQSIESVTPGGVKDISPRGTLHVTYQARSGQSGSPVFDAYGNVIGVHAATNRMRKHAIVTSIAELLPALFESRRRLL
jgi:hypothetical protein